MIEIEKKFLIEPQQRDALLATAKLEDIIRFTDVYWDDPDLALARQDVWLRQRQQAWQMKLPLDQQNQLTNQYQELVDEAEIAAWFGWPVGSVSLKQQLQAHGYAPWVSYHTVRRHYKIGKFTIDLDETDFGYCLMEIELLVDSPDQAHQAEQEILKLAQQYGLSHQPVRGKLLEYLARFHPEQLSLILLE